MNQLLLLLTRFARDANIASSVSHQTDSTFHSQEAAL
jgi:hypothetical protein